MTLLVSLKDAIKASKEEPGFFAERKLQKLRKEYEQLYNKSVLDNPKVHYSFVDLAFGTEPQRERALKSLNCIDPSLDHFLHKFGVNNIAEAIGFLGSISKNKEVEKARIAHFFFHLGRRHERSIFK